MRNLRRILLAWGLLASAGLVVLGGYDLITVARSRSSDTGGTQTLELKIGDEGLSLDSRREPASFADAVKNHAKAYAALGIAAALLLTTGLALKPGSNSSSPSSGSSARS
ncbi:MAG: hypothetical protein IH969_03645 [Candidatus Krumholzibacteriota bacterium]|nr:hypothetical protein [Candidatus Krumholzibacteriota bacterium]